MSLPAHAGDYPATDTGHVPSEKQEACYYIQCKEGQQNCRTPKRQQACPVKQEGGKQAKLQHWQPIAEDYGKTGDHGTIAELFDAAVDLQYLVDPGIEPQERNQVNGYFDKNTFFLHVR